MISRIAMIVFFLVFGVEALWGFPEASVILGVSALVAGIALIAKQ